jgi:hydroxymethylbilane synthase
MPENFHPTFLRQFHSMPSIATPSRLVIASRESRLALVQSEMIAQHLRTLYPAMQVEILGMTTRGDQILDRPLAQVGGKGLFIKELEVAMHEGRADIAVHSMKDMPSSLPGRFDMIVVGEREDPYDALVSNRFAALSALPAGAVVGTSSLRRECQLRIRYPHLAIKSLRGNVETRLRKLDQGEYDAIILAAAGLKRLGLAQRIRASIAPEESLPAIGQGALAIEFASRRGDIEALLQPFTRAVTSAAVTAERALGAKLLGSCDVPLAGHATVDAGVLHLRGFIGMPDGSLAVQGEIRGPQQDAAALGNALGDQLLSEGAREILDRLAAHQ